MAKRFSDTDKWEDPWFRGLSPSYQRFWIYLLDKCDQAGVWEVDFELVRFFLKEDYSVEETVKILADRIVIFDAGKKWGIPKFIGFQYGELSTGSKPHIYVLNLLRSYENKGYPKGIHTLKDKDKDKDKDKERLKWGEKNETLQKVEQWKRERESPVSSAQIKVD